MEQGKRTGQPSWGRWWKEAIPPGLCVTLFILAARMLGIFQEAEWQAFDRFLRDRPPEGRSDRIVIVGIDEQDLNAIGGFPVPDDTLAQAIEQLQRAEPRVIGIDLFRDLTASSDRAPLAQAFQRYSNIVGIDMALNADDHLNVPPPPELPPERVGFADALTDTDGKLRRWPLASRTWDGILRYSFAFTLARQYLEQEGYTVHHGNTQCPPTKVTDQFLSPETHPPQSPLTKGGSSGPPPYQGGVRGGRSTADIFLRGCTQPTDAETTTSSSEPHSSAPLFFSPPFQGSRRFAPTRFLGLTSNTGGYVRTDAYGHQLLVNFCSHPSCYPVLPLQDVLNQNFDPELVRDRVVLIGMTAPSVKDTFVTAAVDQTLFSQHLEPSQTANRSIYGIELHAHVLHHLLGTVLDQRSSWRSLPDSLEYLWIVAWSLGGISIGLVVRSPWVTFIGIGGLTLGLVSCCYGLILLGWWIPLVPPAFSIVGAGLTTAFFDRDLRILAEQRRLTIEQTFDAVHNGPLQNLAVIAREVKSGQFTPQGVACQLDQLNQELRGLYAQMGEAAIGGSDRLYLGNNLVLDVRNPLPELLNQIFTHTLERPFPGFETLRFCITPDFSPLQECLLSPSQKRGICLFFEEALCNVGKHALDATRLEVVCTHSDSNYSLSISDNSPISTSGKLGFFHVGQGTKQAQLLAQSLRGNFERVPNKKRGTQCRLTWKMPQSRFILPNLIQILMTQNDID